MIRCLLSLIALSLVISCEDPDLDATNVLPSSDQPGIFFTDTFTIKSQTVPEDSLVGSNNASPLFLGSMNDPEIGISNASAYVQVRLGSSLSTGFGTGSTFDSIVLTIGYQSIYGDTAAMHHISVSEIDEVMSVDSVYYTSRDFPLKAGGSLGYFSLVPNLKDSIVAGTAKLPPHLRLRLSDALGTRFLQNTTDYTSNDDFVKFFKGLYLNDSADGAGSILLLDPNSPVNAITIYYHPINNSPVDVKSDTISHSYSFLINDRSARNNRFKHSYNPSVFDSLQPSKLYLQSMVGLKAWIQFPYLMNLTASQSVSINKAEIVVKLLPGSSSVLSNHSKVIAYRPDSSHFGLNFLIDDFGESYGSSGYAFANDEYRLNVSRYIQQVLTGKKNNYGIYIVPGGSVSNAQRTILEGGANVKLNVTYTLKNN